MFLEDYGLSFELIEICPPGFPNRKSIFSSSNHEEFLKFLVKYNYNEYTSSTKYLIDINLHNKSFLKLDFDKTNDNFYLNAKASNFLLHGILPKEKYFFPCTSKDDFLKAIMYICRLSVALWKDFHSFDLSEIKES